LCVFRGPEIKGMGESWTVPLDKSGLAVYFGINGRPFLFNGNKGILYDSLPKYAVRVLDVFSKPTEDQPALIKALQARYGDDCAAVLDEVRAYRDGKHPDLAPESRQTGFLRRMVPRAFNVYVSQACNLSCRYCLNQGGAFGKAPSFMSAETAQSLVALIAGIVRAEIYPIVSVTLFGGEPLLSRKAAHVLVRGLQDLNRANLKTRVHVILSTNGTIYDKEIFDILAEQPDCNSAVVSLDAFKATHDQNRPFADRAHGSTFDAVLGNLRRMMEEGIPYSVICVVPHPYDFIAASEELHRLGIRRLEIKQLIRHVYGRPDLPDVFAEDFSLWRKNYLAYSDYHIAYLREKDPADHVDRFALFGDYAQALGGGERGRTLGCGITDQKMAVNSQGRLMPCESFVDEQFEIGDVRTGFDQARYDSFEAWILEHGQFRVADARCRNCFAKLACGGGCYALAYDKNKRLAPLPESSCQFTREKVKIDFYYISRMRKEHPELVPKRDRNDS
jgi:uncharacterized protein